MGGYHRGPPIKFSEFQARVQQLAEIDKATYDQLQKRQEEGDIEKLDEHGAKLAEHYEHLKLGRSEEQRSQFVQDFKPLPIGEEIKLFMSGRKEGKSFFHNMPIKEIPELAEQFKIVDLVRGGVKCWGISVVDGWMLRMILLNDPSQAQRDLWKYMTHGQSIAAVLAQSYSVEKFKKGHGRIDSSFVHHKHARIVD